MKSSFEGVVFIPLSKFADERGWLIELYRNDSLYEMNKPVMSYISMTLPGVSRGPHEHRFQSDLFSFLGPGDFELYLWDKSKTLEKYLVGESNKYSVIVPPGIVHAYKNISDYPGWVYNAPNCLYGGPGKLYPVDEIRYEFSEEYKIPS